MPNKWLKKGELGELTVIRSYGIDPSEGLESFVKFALEQVIVAACSAICLFMILT